MAWRPGTTSRRSEPPPVGSSTNTGRVVSQSRYGGPDQLRLTHQQSPTPATGEVVVRVHAASVNARDWHLMRGEPRLARLMDRTVFGRRGPRVAVRGTDFAGVIVDVGPEVSRWAVGDAVFGEGRGTFADYAVAAADQVWALPAGTDFEEAAAMPLAATTALLCLDEAGLDAGGTVLVNGASGGVGTFVIQAARAGGLQVTAVVSTRNVELAQSLGADEVVDYTLTDFTRAGRTYDAVLDLVGNRSLRELRRTVRPGGRLILSGGGTSGQGRLVGPLRLLLGAAAVARLLPFDVRIPQAVPSRGSLERLAGLAEAGQLRPFVDKTFVLAEAPDAIRYMETEHTRGKVVVVVDSQVSRGETTLRPGV